MALFPTPEEKEEPTVDPYSAAREAMVANQLLAPGRDIRDARVLRAMRSVPRHEFVPLEVRQHSYEDRPLPIGYNQTISQPYIVGFMTECLELVPTDQVLEVGSGCGYQTAVLSVLVARVCTLEIVRPLAERARLDLQRLGYGNVDCREGDGWLGWAGETGGPSLIGCEPEFDAILITCAPTELPEALALQLKEGGRLVAPLGPKGDQTLYRFRKIQGRLNRETLLDVRFVPMTGQGRVPNG